jgi:hypothetical protein
MRAPARNTVAIVAALLYAVSFLLPTASMFDAQGQPAPYLGWEAFQAGWRALLDFEPSEGPSWALAAAWLANPLIWVAVATMIAGRQRTCRAVALVAVLLCLPVLAWFSGAILWHPGYWVWVGSAAILLVSSWLHWAPRAVARGSKEIL